MSDAVVLVARVLIGALFIIEGWKKVTGYADVAAWMETFGVPGVLLPGVIAVEFIGGVAILAGFMTRWAALALAAFTLLAAVIFHMNFADPIETIMFLQNLAIAGGLLMLYAHGGGRYSMGKH